MSKLLDHPTLQFFDGIRHLRPTITQPTICWMCESSKYNTYHNPEIDDFECYDCEGGLALLERMVLSKN